jgi:hypothetical protein
VCYGAKIVSSPNLAKPWNRKAIFHTFAEKKVHEAICSFGSICIFRDSHLYGKLPFCFFSRA